MASIQAQRRDSLGKPPITAGHSKEVPAPGIDDNAKLSKIQIHVHDMHEGSVDSDDTL